MDLEQSVTLLLSENEQLEHDNEQFKLLLSVVKENVELKARIQRSNNDTLEASTGNVFVRLCQLMTAQVRVVRELCSGK